MWDLIVLVPDHCLSFYFQFSNALRIIEMVQLKVWTLYVHIVAQVNHRGLG